MSAAAPAPAAAPAAETPAPPPRSKKPLVLIVVAVVVLGALGGAAWFLLPRFLGTPKPAAAAAVKEPVKATVALGSVVVNLNGEARRYLRVGVSLGVPGPKEAKEVEEHRSQLLDLVISIFSAAEVESLMSEEGKTEIKEELLTRMREELRLEKIASVYFTEFVVQ